MSEHAHGPSYKDYAMVFAGLAVLTTVTVLIAGTQLSQGMRTFLAFAIAAAKTVMVATIFMHLKYETKTIVIFATVPIALAVVFILAIAPDIGVVG